MNSAPRAIPTAAEGRAEFPHPTPTGNNPATWHQNFPFKDNLGALFNHPTQAGNPISETVYSTSTVDTSAAGTTTIDYWATNPATGETIRAIRGIIITAATANDNKPTEESSTPIAANDNLAPLRPTGTDATTTTP